jgi:branched-chain amino acid transport system ATP-binding protein
MRGLDVQEILSVEKLSMTFGGLVALDSVDLKVGTDEIVALIGPNGAGKTTFFNCLSGIYTPSAGDIYLTDCQGKRARINKLKPNKVTEKGIARTFQNIRLFSGMTVLENVMIGCHCRNRSGIIGAIFRFASTKNEERRIVDKSYSLLEQMGLDHYVNEFARNLPYGAQRRLELARALATEPVLLLLDEPAAGMNPKETRELNGLIVKIRDKYKVSILLIEHDMKLVMDVSDRIYVMDYGRRIAHGTAMEVRNDPVVIKAYLGE